MPINPDGTAVCDRCRTTVEGYGVLYGLVTADLSPEVGNVTRRLFCYYHGCRDAALQELVVFPVGSHTDQECATCLAPAAGIGEAMQCSDLLDDGTFRSFSLCYVNGHRDALLTQAYGWTPPLIRLDVAVTTWWNRPEVLASVHVDMSTNWDVFTTNTVVTVTRTAATLWNDQALTTIQPRTAVSTFADGVGTSSATFNKPADAVVGDLLVAAFTIQVTGAITVPDGWTLMGAALKTVNSVNNYIYWRWNSADVAGVTSWSWGLSADSPWGGTMQAFGRVDPANPVDVSPTVAFYTSSSTTTYSANQITTATDNALLLSALGVNSGGASVATSPPAGWTADTVVNDGFTSGKANSLAHLNAVPRGTYGAVWNTSSGRAGDVILGALRSSATAVLFQVVVSRTASWNVASTLTTITASRATTWTDRAAQTVTALTTWTEYTRITVTRATTWNSGATASGIVTRTAVNQNGPATGSENASVTIGRPSDAVVGDVLVTTFSVGGSVTPTAPSGWTLLTSSTQSGANVYLYWHRYTTGDAAAWTWTLSAATTWGGNMQAFGGVHGTTPIDVTSVAATFTTSVASYPVSITTATAGAMLVSGFGANTGGNSLTPTVPSGFTSDVAVNTGFASGKANALAHMLKPSAGGGTYTWTIDSGRAGGVVIAALRPA